MKRRLTEIVRLLTGVVAMVCGLLIALGRLCWKTIGNLWKNRSVKVRKWTNAAVCVLVIWIAGDFCYDICDNVWGGTNGEMKPYLKMSKYDISTTEADASTIRQQGNIPLRDWNGSV